MPATVTVQYVDAFAAQSPVLPMATALMVQPSARHPRISGFTFDDITQPIRQAPPLQRKSVAQHNVGIVVQWQTEFSSASQREDGSVLIQLTVPGDGLKIVYCTITLSDYPELGVLASNRQITVTGRITESDTYSVELEDAELFIHPAAR